MKRIREVEGNDWRTFPTSADKNRKNCQNCYRDYSHTAAFERGTVSLESSIGNKKPLFNHRRLRTNRHPWYKGDRIYYENAALFPSIRNRIRDVCRKEQCIGSGPWGHFPELGFGKMHIRFPMALDTGTGHRF
jgi:hypothetical protein